MANRDRKRKDLALTTLIDLLVQIVFLLAFFIVVNKVIASPSEPNYQELWRHLVESIFDRQPIGEARQQSAAAAAEVKRLRAEVKRLQNELQNCNEGRRACESKLVQAEEKCTKRCGPVACMDGKALLDLTVTQDGLIQAAATESGLGELVKLGVVDLPFNRPLTGKQFEDLFIRVKSAQKEVCLYRVNVSCEDRNQPAHLYEVSMQSINLLFSTPKNQRVCR